MATPVLTETTDTCTSCGEVACERDLFYVGADDDIDGAEEGDVVCRDCYDPPQHCRDWDRGAPYERMSR